MTRIKIVNGVIYWWLDESQLTADFSKHKVLLAINESVQIWQNLFQKLQIGIRFQAVDKEERSAMSIRFRNNGDSDLPEQFGPNTLGYAFFPPISSIWLNDAVGFSDQEMRGYYRLLKILVHEIGHALGFEHYDVGILKEYYDPNEVIIWGEGLIGDIVTLYKEHLDLSKIFPRESDLMKQRKAVLQYLAGSMAVLWKGKIKRELTADIAAIIY